MKSINKFKIISYIIFFFNIIITGIFIYQIIFKKFPNSVIMGLIILLIIGGFVSQYAERNIRKYREEMEKEKFRG